MTSAQPRQRAIWSPSPERIARANLSAFIAMAARRNPAIRDYASLHAFSIDDICAFWDCLWDYLGIVGEKSTVPFIPGSSFLDARWFPGARLNYAENLLRRRDDGPAVVSISEDGERRVTSWRALYDEVSRMAAALRAAGVVPRDRVAACLPNGLETVVACLATTALGAIWSACSPEYGHETILDRLGQIEPKVLFLAEGQRHGGRMLDFGGKNAALIQMLPSVEHFVIVGAHRDLPQSRSQSWSSFVGPKAATEIAFQRCSFDHPLFILYSSGTTGKPKAIVHGAGGSLLQTVKEMVLHCDCRPGEPVFFPATPGWMVWNVMLASLARGSPIVLYDGSPTYPSNHALFDIIAAERVGIARIVPPLLDAYIRAGLRPRDTHDLASLRCILSGSAPLLAHHYEYVYASIKTDLHLMSPAGGTDIMGTLATGNPIGDVYPGQIQCRSLGMKTEVFDENGLAVIGEPGELVCTAPFPSVPLGLWGDGDRSRVETEYFSRFPGVWRHGDWADITPEGSVVIHGRADATLKVNGVRIGTAEIYRALEGVPEVSEAAAVPFGPRGAERVALFVVVQSGRQLDDAMLNEIRESVRRAASARHVPAKIVQVPDLLRSLNGKASEIAIREAVNGRAVANRTGLLNPELISLFQDVPDLRG